jgi:hypothetical protein
LVVVVVVVVVVGVGSGGRRVGSFGDAGEGGLLDD